MKALSFLVNDEGGLRYCGDAICQRLVGILINLSRGQDSEFPPTSGPGGTIGVGSQR